MRCSLRSLLVVAFLVGIASAVAIAAGEPYQEINVLLPSESSLKELMRNQDLDLIRLGDGDARFVSRPSLTANLIAQGWKVEVVHADLESFYASRQAGKLDYGVWHTYAETVAEMNLLHTQYPNLTTAPVSIGLSREGRSIWAMKISDNPNVDEDEPEVLIDGMHHAREIMTVEINLYLRAVSLRELRDATRPPHSLSTIAKIWFIPLVNVDGFVYNETTNPNGGGMWRKNRRNNGDGSYGVDINRNYPYMWGLDDNGSSPTTSSETYRGPSAGSEPETQAYMDFVNLAPLRHARLVPLGGGIDPLPLGLHADPHARRRRPARNRHRARPGQRLHDWPGPGDPLRRQRRQLRLDVWRADDEVEDLLLLDRGGRKRLLAGSVGAGRADRREPALDHLPHAGRRPVREHDRPGDLGREWQRPARPGRDGRSSGDDQEHGARLEPDESLDPAPLRRPVRRPARRLERGRDARERRHVSRTRPIRSTFRSTRLVRTRRQITFTVVADADAGVHSETPFVFVVGTSSVIVANDFENAGEEWTQDATHTATTGAFVRIDPVATTFQPGDDTTPAPGVYAWITAQNPTGSVGVDDVDGGVAATRSPDYDLSAYGRVRLSMNYFHGQRDTGGDAGDFFKIDVSPNGGTSWVNLVQIGDVATAATWRNLSVNLGDYISLTNQVRFRVQAADGTAIGEIIEGGIDDFYLYDDGSANMPPSAPVLNAPANGATGVASARDAHRRERDGPGIRIADIRFSDLFRFGSDLPREIGGRGRAGWWRPYLLDRLRPARARDLLLEVLRSRSPATRSLHAGRLLHRDRSNRHRGPRSREPARSAGRTESGATGDDDPLSRSRDHDEPAGHLRPGGQACAVARYGTLRIRVARDRLGWPG